MNKAKIRNSMLYDFDRGGKNFLRFFKEISNADGRLDPEKLRIRFRKQFKELGNQINGIYS